MHGDQIVDADVDGARFTTRAPQPLRRASLHDGDFASADGHYLRCTR